MAIIQLETKTETEMISVVIPLYNKEKSIEQTLNSVLAQTYTDFECIIVNDGSTDKSPCLVEKWLSVRNEEQDTHFCLINKENGGVSSARNRGIEAARGDIVAFLDGDDLWESNKLEKQIQFMTEKNIGFSFTSYEVISETGIDLNKTVRVPNMIDYEGLLGNTIIGCLTVVIDRNIIRDVEMPLIRTRQDFATWLNILKKGY